MPVLEQSPDSYRPSGASAPAAERTCGAPGCTGRWLAPWKNRRRPVFEREWGCSTRCLSALVAAAVRRELADGVRAEPNVPHRHRVPLGLVLLAQGWITHPQLRMALEHQRASGTGRIGDWLAESCGLAEEQITRGLGMQWNRPVLAMDGFSPSAMAVVMPPRLVQDFGLVPLRVAGSQLLYMAFQNQMDAAAALAVEHMSGLRVETGLLPDTDYAAARASILAAESAPMELKTAGDRDALVSAMVKALTQWQPAAAKLVRVHHYYWLRMWLESGAMSGTAMLPPGPEDVQDVLVTFANRA